LKARYNLKLVVVSNEGRELTEHRIRRFRMAEYIDAFVASSFVHFRKPDADIYRIALDLSQTPAENVLYLDDRELFVEVARTLGIRGVRHRDLATTRAELAGMGLEPAGE
jgi:putative hydrolase of the HAD superfamily